MRSRECALCDRPLGHAEPTYPARIDDQGVDVAVCVECAFYLSRHGLGAWTRLSPVATTVRAEPPKT